MSRVISFALYLQNVCTLYSEYRSSATSTFSPALRTPHTISLSGNKIWSLRKNALRFTHRDGPLREGPTNVQPLVRVGLIGVKILCGVINSLRKLEICRTCIPTRNYSRTALVCECGVRSTGPKNCLCRTSMLFRRLYLLEPPDRTGPPRAGGPSHRNGRILQYRCSCRMDFLLTAGTISDL